MGLFGPTDMFISQQLHLTATSRKHSAFTGLPRRTALTFVRRGILFEPSKGSMKCPARPQTAHAHPPASPQTRYNSSQGASLGNQTSKNIILWKVRAGQVHLSSDAEFPPRASVAAQSEETDEDEARCQDWYPPHTGP